MDTNQVEQDSAERDLGVSAGGAGGGLEVLQQLTRAYEQRMDLIQRGGGPRKAEKQVELLVRWVGDLVAQNTLLARVVEELELEAGARLVQERRKHAEECSELRGELGALRRRARHKDADLHSLLELLRRLRDSDARIDDIHFFEVTESDIFGTPDWRHKKCEEGEPKGDHNLQHELNKMKGSWNYSKFFY